MSVVVVSVVVVSVVGGKCKMGAWLDCASVVVS